MTLVKILKSFQLNKDQKNVGGTRFSQKIAFPTMFTNYGEHFPCGY